MARALSRLLLWTAVLVLPALGSTGTMLAVNVALNPPGELFREALPDQARLPDRCTWACHDQGCAHTPLLGWPFTGPDSLYPWTIRSLYRLGGGTNTGYGAANLVLFCVLWPGLMQGLLLLSVSQRLRIRALRSKLQERSHD